MEENLRIPRLMDSLLQSPLSNDRDGEDNMDCVIFPDFTLDVVRAISSQFCQSINFCL